jgi:hypothetical protein
MNYDTFIQELAATIQLKTSILQYDLSIKEKDSTDLDIVIYSKERTDNFLVPSVQYKENLIQKWECITLFIRKNEEITFVEAINEVLTKNNIERIDFDLNKRFELTYQGLFWLVGCFKNGQFVVELARFKTN